MLQRSQPHDLGRTRWVRPEVFQTKPCSVQQALCFSVGEAQATKGHGSTNPPEETPDESDTHGLADLAEEMPIEPRNLSHGLDQVGCLHPRRHFQHVRVRAASFITPVIS